MVGMGEETEPCFINLRDVRSIRPAGGTWTGKVALVSLGERVTEIAIKGTVLEVAAKVNAARK